MPLKNYGVLKGRAIDIRQGSGTSAHYQVKIIDNEYDYRIAINIQSALWPSELEYVVIENFLHPITSIIEVCRDGYTHIESRPGKGGLDYIRGNLFNKEEMRKLPAIAPGIDNDLNEKINSIMQKVLATEDSIVYAFGERWGPEEKVKDKYFGFLPGNGIHDIHMNQSNVGQFIKDDGVWQDGGILVNFPSKNEWVAIFLKFQSQGWHTNDTTGHVIENMVTPTDGINTGDPQGLIRIVAALVNSENTPEDEYVSIINTSPYLINLEGWSIADTNKRKQMLSGSLKAGQVQTIQIEKPVELSNKGGILSLIDDKGIKVDGVSYTKKDASRPGWTLVF